MSNSTPNFTPEDFKAARSSVKAGLNHAEIKYTLDGQPHTFTTEGVSGGFSQTLIFGGENVGIAWRYPTPGLEDGSNSFLFKELLNAVFYASSFDTYTQVLEGRLDVGVKITQDGDKETAEITGTITDALFSNGTNTVTVRGKFTQYLS
ncbi:hypothetical protein ACI77M_15590 [Pseudomonas fildesensis]|uniref:hypothetical protein n=1 Tax=Pseudomonas fildesensis TaxID=1674920 RepID=UPI00387B366B